LDYVLLLTVVAVLSVVQSIFGMGVLVFGTPTLLLMGYDFIATLGFLLPASFSISLLQMLTAGSDRVPISKYLYLLCLPGIGAGLWLAENSLFASWINIMVGGTLMLSALVRLWSPSRTLLTRALKRHLPAYHLAMGAIHGLTNLGGGLLAILASGTNTDKLAIRNTVAHYYLAFSVVQMLLLATVMGHHNMLIANLPSAAVSASVYLLIGNRLFSRTSGPFFDRALTIFIAVYGVVVLFELT
jgi:uncharacterized protein